MKNINFKVSNECHRFLVDYKLKHGFKNVGEAIEDIVKSLKGGTK